LYLPRGAVLLIICGTVSQRTTVYLGSPANGRCFLLLEKVAAPLRQTTALEAKAHQQL